MDLEERSRRNVTICAMRVLFSGALLLSGRTEAANIGHDCKPFGLINIVKEAASPVSFWTAALKEVDDAVNGAQLSYRLTQLENRNDKIRANLDASEMRAMGISPELDPKTRKVLAEADKLIEDTERNMLSDTLRWAVKCRAYANQKLGK